MTNFLQREEGRNENKYLLGLHLLEECQLTLCIFFFFPVTIHFFCNHEVFLNYRQKVYSMCLILFVIFDAVVNLKFFFK